MAGGEIENKSIGFSVQPYISCISEVILPSQKALSNFVEHERGGGSGKKKKASQPQPHLSSKVQHQPMSSSGKVTRYLC